MAFRSKFKWVSYQIKQDLLQPFLICINMVRDLFLFYKLKLKPFYLWLDPQDALHLLVDIFNIEPGLVQDKLVHLKFWHIENVVNCSKEELTTRIGDIQHNLWFLWHYGADLVIYAQNRVDRSPQVMGYRSEVNCFKLAQSFGLFIPFEVGYIWDQNEDLLFTFFIWIFGLLIDLSNLNFYDFVVMDDFEDLLI
jgi:hypothetical protein